MPFSRFGAKTSLVNGVKMATCLLSTLVFIFTSRYGLTCSKAHYHVFCPNEKLNCPDFKTLWRYLHTENLIAIKWLMSLWGPCKVKSDILEVLLFYTKFKKIMTSFSPINDIPNVCKIAKFRHIAIFVDVVFLWIPRLNFKKKCMTGAFNQIAARSS
jgi:hypothetical protein